MPSGHRCFFCTGCILTFFYKFLFFQGIRWSRLQTWWGGPFRTLRNLADCLPQIATRKWQVGCTPLGVSASGRSDEIVAGHITRNYSRRSEVISCHLRCQSQRKGSWFSSEGICSSARRGDGAWAQIVDVYPEGIDGQSRSILDRVSALLELKLVEFTCQK